MKTARNIAMTLALGASLSIAHGTVHAAGTTTEPEEQRGAVIGGLIGAGLGGPIGAGAGAMIGGGLIGKAVGAHRANVELKTELAKTLEDRNRREARLNAKIERLNDALVSARNERPAVAAATPAVPIQFRTASAELEQHYRAHLAELARSVAAMPEARVNLAGFADRRGDADYNLKLSQERVASVQRFLEDNGVAPAQIVTEAHGETKPVTEAETPENHFFDRRVVMEFSVSPAEQPVASR